MNFFANTGAVAVSIRAAREDDTDRIVEIHISCYPDERTAAQRRLNFVQNAMGRFDDLRVAERDGRVVGHGFGFSLAAWFGGVSVPIVGVASVGVAPEARGSGVGRAIVSELEREGRSRGAVLAVLHPFRHTFYRALGYADVTPQRRLVVDPRAVPEAWVTAARDAPLRAADANDTTAIVELHRGCARRALGWIERPSSLWGRIFASERLPIVMLGDTGYVAFEVVQSEPHAKTVVRVRELVTAHAEARRTLWGFLGMQAGQADEVQIEVADDDPIAFALTDIDGNRRGDAVVEHALGTVVAGPMVKALDVKAALEARGYPSDGESIFDLGHGPSLRVTAKSGRASVRLEEAPAGAVKTDARTLTSMAFGGLGVRGALALGLAHGDDAALASADALLGGPPFHTLDRF
jgi:predicted acetyltransferase